MPVLENIKTNLQKNIAYILNIDLSLDDIELDLPPNEDLGDYAFPCFELAKQLGKSPVEAAKDLAEKFVADELIVAAKNAGPYLNLSVEAKTFAQAGLTEISSDQNFGQHDFGKKQKIMIEFSGPNTNKPQHLGHVRNNIIGQTLVNLHNACGFKVIPVNIINDRGIHIIKSMLAYQKWGKNSTPESTKTKGDHFVGQYYVKFENDLKQEREKYLKENKINLAKLPDLEQRKIEEEFLAQSPLMQEAQTVLQKWEAGDKEIRALWKKMNDWVYQGFEETYKNLGIGFDKVYYESETYLLGKDLVKAGLKKGVFYKKEDNSIWIDLKDVGLDEKIVQRKDGTAVYLTQDLGTAKDRYDEFKFNKLIYVVANEQNYHFKVLFATLKKLGFAWADNLYHLAYGMVNLPDGKMKSREGNIVDADDLIQEMQTKATEIMAAAQKQVQSDKKITANIVGLGALKFFILGTNPQKDIVFDPMASISFDGYTGPFIQYTHARINNILNKVKKLPTLKDLDFDLEINPEEKKLIKICLAFPEATKQATLTYNPSILTQYLFEVAKTFNNFYQHHSVLQAETKQAKDFRLHLCKQTKQVLSNGLSLLGIEAPEVM